MAISLLLAAGYPSFFRGVGQFGAAKLEKVRRQLLPILSAKYTQRLSLPSLPWDPASPDFENGCEEALLAMD